MKEVICGIYEIVNKVNGKKYIGQSIDVYRRWREEKCDLNKDEAPWNVHLWRAWKLYGAESFEFNVLEACNECLLDEKEAYYIELYDTQNNGYNIESGGNVNKHLAQETKDKISASHFGKSLPKEVCDKMSVARIGNKNPMYGKHHTQDTKNLISANNIGKTGHQISEYQKQRAREANIGKIVSQETRDKLSKSQKGKTPHNKNKRQVYCVELNIIFSSASDAAKKLKLASYGILECCRHNRYTCGGYHWEYADEITNHNEINELVM